MAITMNNKGLSLKAMERFFEKEITVGQLNQCLDELYTVFTNAVMHVSFNTGNHVTEDQISARYTLEMLRDIFKETEFENEQNTTQ